MRRREAEEAAREAAKEAAEKESLAALELELRHHHEEAARQLEQQRRETEAAVKRLEEQAQRELDHINRKLAQEELNRRNEQVHRQALPVNRLPEKNPFANPTNVARSNANGATPQANPFAKPTPPHPEVAAVKQKDVICNGDLTSNGCVPPPAAPPPPPINVTIGGNQAAPTGNSSSGNPQNVPTPCQDLTGSAGCQGQGQLPSISVPAAPIHSSQFPTSTGMAQDGKTNSSKPYYNNNGWKFNHTSGLWENPNPNDPNQTLIPAIITCCDDTGLAFPSDAVNAPSDKVANADSAPQNGCSIPPMRLRQLLEYMTEVRNRTHRFPKEIAAAIEAGGAGCEVPSLRTCLTASLHGKTPPPGCPSIDAGSDDGINDTAVGDDGGNKPAKGADTQNGTSANAAPPSSTDDNEAYCAYMASKVVRGELTPRRGDPIPPGCHAAIAAAEAARAQEKAKGNQPFTMDQAESQKEIDRLLGNPQNQ